MLTRRIDLIVNANNSNVNTNNHNSYIENQIKIDSKSIFNEISKAINNSIIDMEVKSKSMLILDEWENVPPKTEKFIEKYRSFMDLLAVHVTVLTSFLPQLTSMLKI